ncbi:MAG TPA: methionine adenosyltransferase [Patescibacteria group bacterium]|nr:methionine adenosyltransferase [Patescibacteria group bacterium]
MKKTVESVTQGHPDKICDQIADAIVDEYLRRDKQARVDINVLGSHGMMMIGGEVTSTADFDLGALAKQVYAEIGYKDDVEVFVNIDTQSAEMKRVHNGVTDNVVVNGFATNETRELLPRAVVYAHNLARRLDDLRKTDPAFSWLKPDGKIQLTMDGDHVCGVTVLASHQVSIDEKDVKTALLERLLVPILGEDGVAMYINPIGTFIDAGFKADSGASGRKMTVDTYGGLIPQGDKSISGKDPSRVDRAGAYMARFTARYLVEQGLATSAMVSLVYSMGRAEPVHIHVTGMGGKMPGRAGSGLQAGDLTELLKKTFDFRPEAIAERLNLFQPVYRATAAYGHFGRAGFPWEESAVV